MEPEQKAEKYEEGEESLQKEEDIQSWVKANAPDTASDNKYIRLKYYNENAINENN